MRTFVTGVSGAPFNAVVRNVASSAAAPLASNATAAAVSATRCSFKPPVISCALANNALHTIIKPATIIFIC
jgi:hypothetical protein